MVYSHNTTYPLAEKQFANELKKVIKGALSTFGIFLVVKFDATL